MKKTAFLSFFLWCFIVLALVSCAEAPTSAPETRVLNLLMPLCIIACEIGVNIAQEESFGSGIGGNFEQSLEGGDLTQTETPTLNLPSSSAVPVP